MTVENCFEEDGGKAMLPLNLNMHNEVHVLCKLRVRTYGQHPNSEMLA